MALSLDLEQRPKYWRFSLSGDLDYDVAEEFQAGIDRILESEPRFAIVDMSGVRYLDSSGLGVLLSMSREYEDVGGRLVLIVNESVDTILTLVRLNGIFATARTMEDAVRMLEHDTPRRWSEVWAEKAAAQ